MRWRSQTILRKFGLILAHNLKLILKIPLSIISYRCSYGYFFVYCMVRLVILMRNGTPEIPDSDYEWTPRVDFFCSNIIGGLPCWGFGFLIYQTLSGNQKRTSAFSKCRCQNLLFTAPVKPEKSTIYYYGGDPILPVPRIGGSIVFFSTDQSNCGKFGIWGLAICFFTVFAVGFFFF